MCYWYYSHNYPCSRYNFLHFYWLYPYIFRGSSITARVKLSQLSLNSSDRQSLANRSFNNSGTDCWSAGPWLWIYPCMSNQALSLWLSMVPLPGRLQCLLLSSESYLISHIHNSTTLFCMWFILILGEVVQIETLCFFFLHLNFDLHCRHKSRAWNDHHCFIWWLPW